jgi:acyl carrier protein
MDLTGCDEATRDVLDIAARISSVLAEAGDTIRAMVLSTLREVRACGESEMSLDDGLMDDIGLDSLEVVELVTALQASSGVVIAFDTLSALIASGAAHPLRWDAELSERDLTRLAILLPEVPAHRIAPGLRVMDVSTLFTVETIVRLIALGLPVPDRLCQDQRSEVTIQESRSSHAR